MSTNSRSHARYDTTSSMLHKDGMERIAETINKLTVGGGQTDVRIDGWWRSDIRWGRNRPGQLSDSRDYNVFIARRVDGGYAFTNTNQIASTALEDAVRLVEHTARTSAKQISRPQMSVGSVAHLEAPTPTIWSEETIGIALKERARVAGSLVEKFKSRNVLSSGFIEWRGYESMSFGFGVPDSAGHENVQTLQENSDDMGALSTPGYIRHTQAQCSMTAFHPGSTTMGWAGFSSFDWGAIDCDALVDRALEKCVSSVNPQSLEPGRYTVILEPQAVMVLTTFLVNSLDRARAERGQPPFAYLPDRQLGTWRTRLGMKIVDERITISHDPMDPTMGVLPARGLRPVVWIENGKLVNLAYDESYSRRVLGNDVVNLNRPGFRMEGGSNSMDEMIASTTHGVLISNLSDVIVLDPATLLVTGHTTNGLWEVKEGRITNALHNMRFTDSPLYAFNEVKQIGPAAPVFMPSGEKLCPVVVPSVKVNVFALTASTRSL